MRIPVLRIVGFMVLLLFLSGCTYTIDPRDTQVSLPDPSIDSNIPTQPPIIPPILMPPLDQNGVDSNTSVPPVIVPPIPDTNVPVSPPPVEPTVLLSKSEVATHAKRGNCWMIIHGRVYNLSTFTNHPGGTNFVPFCGKDGTSAFEGQGHSSVADALLTHYFIGVLNETIPLTMVNP